MRQEWADFEAPECIAGAAEALARTMGAGAEEASEAAGLIESSLKSNVIRRARLSARCFREVPFCVRRGDAVIDGKIDLLFEEDDGVVVVDYKTDNLPHGGASVLADRYRDQATVYGIAAGIASGLPVKEVVLLFMRGPVEERVAVRGSREEQEHTLDELLAKASARPR